MKTILLIDDCIDFRETTSLLLMEAGHDVWEAGSPTEAFELLKQEKFDLVVCDLQMPLVATGEISGPASYEVGIRTIQNLKELFPQVPIIAMSSTSQADLRRLARSLDSIPAYTKPFHGERIIEIIDAHLTAPRELSLVQ